jgi:hypothetical protein
MGDRVPFRPDCGGDRRGQPSDRQTEILQNNPGKLCKRLTPLVRILHRSSVDILDDLRYSLTPVIYARLSTYGYY